MHLVLSRILNNKAYDTAIESITRGGLTSSFAYQVRPQIIRLLAYSNTNYFNKCRSLLSGSGWINICPPYEQTAFNYYQQNDPVPPERCLLNGNIVSEPEGPAVICL